MMRGNAQGRVVRSGQAIISPGRLVRFRRLTRCAGDRWVEAGAVGRVVSVLPELWIDMDDDGGPKRVRLQQGFDAGDVFEVVVSIPSPCSNQTVELEVARCLSSLPPA